MTSESDKKGLVVSFWNNLLQFFTFTKRHISFFPQSIILHVHIYSFAIFNFLSRKANPQFSFSKIDWKNMKIIIYSTGLSRIKADVTFSDSS